MTETETRSNKRIKKSMILAAILLATFFATAFLLRSSDCVKYGQNPYFGEYSPKVYTDGELNEEAASVCRLALNADGKGTLVTCDGLVTGKWEEMKECVEIDGVKLKKKGRKLVYKDGNTRIVFTNNNGGSTNRYPGEEGYNETK